MSFWPKKLSAAPDLPVDLLGLPEATAAPVASRENEQSKTAVHTTSDSTEGGLSIEARQRAAVASKALMAVFGEITNIAMRSPKYKHHSLADLEWLVIPAVATGQYVIAEAQAKETGLLAPVTVVLWASVSVDVDRRILDNLSAPIRLSPEEWRSGDILWLIDIVGDPRMAPLLVRNVAANQWRGRQIKMKTDAGTNGQVGVSIRTADELLATDS